MNEIEKEIITRISETFTDFNCTRKDLLGISLNFYPDDIEKIYEYIDTFVSMNLPEKYFSYDYSKRNKLFLIHVSFDKLKKDSIIDYYKNYFIMKYKIIKGEL